MNLLTLSRAPPVRYALLFSLFSSVVMGVLLAVIYWWTSSLLERHLDENIEAQFQVLSANLQQNGRESVIGLARQHKKHYADSQLHMLVQNRAGTVLAGDLPPTQSGEGWHDVALLMPAADGGMQRRFLRSRGDWLDDDLFVLVANDTRDLRETHRLILRAFAIALGVNVLIALGGGFAIAGMLLRQVEAVNRTAHAIMQGDLSQRIPVTGKQDELGGLAGHLNTMLGRIEELMANLQHVTSDIAHDLRTPLARLRQRLETARTKRYSSAEYEALIDSAIAESDAMNAIFDAMLRIAQIESGARRAKFAQVNLSDVAENVVDAFTAVAEDSGKRLAMTIEPAIEISGDRDLLTQMLANLVENAIRHTPAGADLAVRLERTGTLVRINVTDNGAGIPETQFEHVFTRFYRLDHSRTTSGSGLGLSLVAAIVKLHKARITLRNNDPGLSVNIEFDVRQGQ